MDILQNPDNQRRIKLVGAIIISYIISFAVADIFFLSQSPSLNPQAFGLLGERVGSVPEWFGSFFEIESKPTPILTQPVEPSQAPLAQPTIQTPAWQPTLFPTIPSQPTALPSVRVPTVALPTAIPTQPKVPTSAPTVKPTSGTTKVTYADFGKCLNENGMVEYMSATCGLCSQQKKTLKDAYEYIRAVDCNASQQNGLECSKAGVRGLPTWAKDGKAVLSGPQSLQTLGETAGCQVPTE